VQIDAIEQRSADLVEVAFAYAFGTDTFLLRVVKKPQGQGFIEAISIKLEG
jgi:hypothetical protein